MIGSWVTRASTESGSNFHLNNYLNYVFFVFVFVFF